MLFLYILEKDIADSLIEKGFQQIGTTMINGIEASIFQNSKELKLSLREKYSKTLFTNQLMF